MSDPLGGRFGAAEVEHSRIVLPWAERSLIPAMNFGDQTWKKFSPTLGLMILSWVG
jgi:hypothetical protein